METTGYAAAMLIGGRLPGEQLDDWALAGRRRQATSDCEERRRGAGCAGRKQDAGLNANAMQMQVQE